MGRRISKEFLHPSILEGVNDKIGNLDSLETNAKGIMVQAINELVDNLNRTSELEDELNEGKKLISDAIADDNINENSTFNDMSEAIKSKINNSQQLFFNGDKFGGQYFFIIKNDGSLWACGSNSYGQLGLGDKSDRNVFTQVTTNINNDVKDIGIFLETSNSYRSGVIVIKNDGTVLFSGYCPLTDTVYSTFTII